MHRKEQKQCNSKLAAWIREPIGEGRWLAFLERGKAHRSHTS